MMRAALSRADAVALGLIALVLLMVSTVYAQQASRAEEYRTRTVQDLRYRTVCAANLRGLAQSMAVYAADNNDAYPYLPGTSATTYDVTLKPEIGVANSDQAIASLYKDKKYPNNPYASLWLLAMSGQVAPRQFICPGDPFAYTAAASQAASAPGTDAAPAISALTPAKITDEKKNNYLNFQDKKNISYSTMYQWGTGTNGKIIPARGWRAMTDASMPILSDMAPYLGKKAKAGEAATRPAGPADAAIPDEWAARTANSQNHLFEGENIAYQDAHVEFNRRPDIGQNNDSIWTIQDKDGKNPAPFEAGVLPHEPAGTPGNYDTVMIPTRDAKGELR